MPKEPVKPSPDDDDEVKDAGKQVVVDDAGELDDKDEGVGAKPKVIDVDEEEEVDIDLKTLDRKAFAAMRKENTETKRALAERDKKLKELEDRLNKQPVVPTPTYPASMSSSKSRELYDGVPIPETREEWDALAHKDWKLAIDMSNHLSNRRAIAEYEQQKQRVATLEESKQRTLAKHPELSDVSSEKSKIYAEILDRNRHYLSDPRGPYYAMRDMEDEMESRGYTKEQIFGNKSKTTNDQAEATRASRAALTSAGRSNEKPAGRTVMLSKDDLEFCRVNDLDPKEYAKSKIEHENRSKGAQL